MKTQSDARLNSKERVRILKRAEAVTMGYSPDNRKRKRQHRRAARELVGAGTFLNASAPRGSTPYMMAQWHLAQARAL